MSTMKNVKVIGLLLTALTAAGVRGEMATGTITTSTTELVGCHWVCCWVLLVQS